MTKRGYQILDGTAAAKLKDERREFALDVLEGLPARAAPEVVGKIVFFI